MTNTLEPYLSFPIPPNVQCTPVTINKTHDFLEQHLIHHKGNNLPFIGVGDTGNVLLNYITDSPSIKAAVGTINTQGLIALNLYAFDSAHNAERTQQVATFDVSVAIQHLIHAHII